jgi:hypothetical protein
MHFPQLPDEDGWDVNATYPMILGDDFYCTDSGPVLDVHFWGSWKNGIEGEITSFFMRFHEDIPADPPQIPYSRPGAMLWEREIISFSQMPIISPTPEGWYDPSTGEVIFDDHQEYFQYDVCFDSTDQDLFVQNSGTIYWLVISANVADPQGTTWGWKSTEDHWNDDGVWAYWGEWNWIDMWEPYPFRERQQSLDLSFVITGEDFICDCLPGDCNNDGTVNVGDAVCMISWIFQGGLPPAPHNICSGDANCDCQANVGDAVYIIAYVFKGGPAPCTCEEWVSYCGWPIFK